MLCCVLQTTNKQTGEEKDSCREWISLTDTKRVAAYRRNAPSIDVAEGQEYELDDGVCLRVIERYGYMAICEEQHPNGNKRTVKIHLSALK